jgi:hypothetical protein
MIFGLGLGLALTVLGCAPQADGDEEPGPLSAATPRSAYEAACVHFEPAAYCSCVADGFEKALTVNEMRLAGLAVKYNRASSDGARERALAEVEAGARKLGFANKRKREDALARIDAQEEALRASCAPPPH